LVTALAALGSRDVPVASSGYLDAARGAAVWLRTAAIRSGAGVVWPADPTDRASVNTSLYAGTPGVVLFFLEMAEATGDGRYLQDARAGADSLVAGLADAEGTGLWEGSAGIAFVLQETAKATGDRRYADAARRAVREIVARAKVAGAGVEWSPTTDIISGSAGTGLFLMYAARECQDPSLLALAVKAGDRLVELGRPEGGGLKWAMDPEFPRLMPNFSHGTAGIAYFLATLYGETHARRFLEAASAGARYLQSVAATAGDVCLIFHDEPDGKDLYYLGWCHGPVGTARLFHRLGEVTGDLAWREWTRRAARALRASGIPEKRTPGFWNNVGQCCGSAGVIEFFLALARVDQDPSDLAFAERVADDLVRRATREGDGLKWIQAEHRVRPDLLVAQTGYMQGASGIGASLLHLWLAEQGRRPPVRLVDSPF
jgi:lantibiotic modifying enzyme